MKQIDEETISHSQSTLATKRCVLQPAASIADSTTTAHAVNVTAAQPKDERYRAIKDRLK